MFTDIILIILFVFDFSLLYMFYFYNPTGTINRFLSLLLIPIMLSNIEMLLLRNVVSTLSIDIGLNMAFLGGLAFFPLFYHFSNYYPRNTMTRRKKRQIAIIYFETLALGIALFVTYLLKPETVTQEEVWNIIPFFKRNPVFFGFYIIMFIYSTVILILTINRFLKSYQMNLMPAEKRNIIMILAGLIPVSMMMIFSYFIFLPLKSGINFYLVISSFYTIYFIILIFSFGYLDRRALIRTIFTYPFSIIIVFVLFNYGLTDFNQRICEVYRINLQVLIAVEILLLFFFIQPVVRFFERRLFRSGSGVSTDFHNSLKNSAGGLSGIITMPELNTYLDDLFYDKLKIANYWLMIRAHDNSDFVLSTGVGRDEFRFPGSGELAGKLEGYRKIMNIQQMSLAWHGGDEMQVLYEEKIVLIAPLFERGDLIGFFMFGEPGPARAWYPAEIEELELFLSGVPVVIARCSIYEKAIALEKKQASIEKMAVLSEISSGIAHEIRNPLSIISASAETMAVRDLTPDEVKKFASYIQDETGRMSGLLNRILSISVNSEAKHRPTNIVLVIKRSLDLVASKLRKKNILMDFSSGSESLIAVIDKEVLMQVCLNLVLNAVDAMSPGMRLRVAVEGCSPGKVKVVFANEGERIPEDIRDRIFDPFFTTKKTGTGLGLSISQRLIEEAGGTIELIDSDSETVFQIMLPAPARSMR